MAAIRTGVAFWLRSDAAAHDSPSAESGSAPAPSPSSAKAAPSTIARRTPRASSPANACPSRSIWAGGMGGWWCCRAIWATTTCRSTPITEADAGRGSRTACTLRRAMKKLAALLVFITVPLHAASRLPVREPHAMVASVDEIASRIGADVMKRGGNAVDAAVAVALTLAVTWPEAGNLGGGGFMLVRKADGTTEAIDYPEIAPLSASRNMYLDAEGNVIKDASLVGYKAIAVPGTVAGLAFAHKRYCKLPWRGLVEPARKLAAEGFPVSPYLARSLALKQTGGRMQ